MLPRWSSQWHQNTQPEHQDFFSSLTMFHWTNTLIYFICVSILKMIFLPLFHSFKEQKHRKHRVRKAIKWWFPAWLNLVKPLSGLGKQICHLGNFRKSFILCCILNIFSYGWLEVSVRIHLQNTCIIRALTLRNTGDELWFLMVIIIHRVWWCSGRVLALK